MERRRGTRQAYTIRLLIRATCLPPLRAGLAVALSVHCKNCTVHLDHSFQLRRSQTLTLYDLFTFPLRKAMPRCEYGVSLNPSQSMRMCSRKPHSLIRCPSNKFKHSVSPRQFLSRERSHANALEPIPYCLIKLDQKVACGKWKCSNVSGRKSKTDARQ